MRTRKILAATLALLGAAAGAEEPAPGICEQQIRTIVAERFGHTVRAIEFRWQERKTQGNVWNMSEAIVYVEECPGYYYFDINGDDYNCQRQAHIGRPPIYPLFRSANDGC